MSETIHVDEQPIKVEREDTVSDVKYKAGVNEEEILHGQVQGEMKPLNEDDPVKIVEDGWLTTFPGGEDEYYGLNY